MNQFEEISNYRFVLLGRQILNLATLGQTCDVTFFKNKPAIDVTVDEQLAFAVMAGCSGPETLYEILQDIRLSNGTTVNINDIWTINAMPEEGFTEEELEAVDMSQAEQNRAERRNAEEND